MALEGRGRVHYLQDLNRCIGQKVHTNYKGWLKSHFINKMFQIRDFKDFDLICNWNKTHRWKEHFLTLFIRRGSHAVQTRRRWKSTTTTTSPEFSWSAAAAGVESGTRRVLHRWGRCSRLEVPWSEAADAGCHLRREVHGYRVDRGFL